MRLQYEWLLAQHQRFTNCVLVYLSLHHELHSPRIIIGLGHFAGSPDEEIIFEAEKMK
jgi:hypothetical protein